MLQRLLARGKRWMARVKAPRVVKTCPFDPTFYATRYPDVREAGLDPRAHFVSHGWTEGRSPHPSVDVEAFWTTTGDQQWRSPEVVLELLVASMSERRVVVSRARSGYFGPTLDNAEPVRLSQAELDLADADLVTFDCWDTLVQRSVHPDYVKLVGARTALALTQPADPLPGHAHESDGADWALLRLRLQVEGDLALRPTCDKCRGDGSVHEYGHLEAISAWLAEAGFASQRIEQMAGLVRDRELTFEREVVRAHPVGAAMLGDARRLGHPVAVVTDTYYERGDIQSLLAGVGLQVGVEDIYASCQFDESKRHGSLLEIVRGERGVSPARHLHVGDSPEADRDSQVRGGGVALMVPPPRHEFPLTPALAAHHMLTHHAEEAAVFANGRVDHVGEVWAEPHGRTINELAAASRSLLFWDGYRLGPALAALLAGAADLRDRSATPTRRIFFLSREGHVLAAIAKRAQEAELFPSELAVEHLAVSRVSTLLPTLRSDVTDLMRIWNQYSVQSPAQLWATLRLTQERTARQTFKGFGHDWAAPVTYPWEVPTFMKALDKLWPIIQADAAEAHSGFQAYLLGRRFLSEERPMCVDVGWRGTIQDNLTVAARRPTRGVYLGLFPMLNNQVEVEKWAVAFDENRHALREDSPLRRITPIERLLTAHTASAQSYSGIGDPIFGPLHHLDFSIVQALETFQHGVAEGAIDALAEMRAASRSREERAELAAQAMLDLLSAPTSSVAALYFSLIHDESFGVGRVATAEERAESWPEARDVLDLEPVS